MFRLMDRVPEGIQPMLDALEEFIISAGLADIVAAADNITQVCCWVIFDWNYIEVFLQSSTFLILIFIL